jgi:rhomboid protease GluP
MPTADKCDNRAKKLTARVIPEIELPPWLKVTGKTRTVRALIVINTVIFAAMAGASGIKSLFIPSSQVLLHFGASSGAATIIDGQFWRTATSAFVHIGFLHLMMNCYVLWDVGPLVEKLFGSRKFIVIYLMAALGASLSSLMFNPIVVSAGASGAIFGLFGALGAFFWRHRTKFPAGFLKLHGKILAIFILYGIVYGAIMQGVDNAAHIGGLLSGFVSALALMPAVPGETNYRKRDILVTAGLAVCFLGFLAADCKSIAGNSHVIGDAAYQQAVELLQKHKTAQALPLLNEAATLMPEVPSVHWDRARAYQSLKQYDDALADCDEAIRLEPKNKMGFMIRGSIFHAIGEEGNSISDLTRLIQLDPKNAMAYNNRAWSYAAMGNYDAALKDIDIAIKMDRNASTFYDTRAVALYLSNHCDEALKELSKATSLRHGDGAYSYHRACIYKKLGKQELADLEMKKAELLGYTPEPWETKLN